jgi:hypothetical protein
MDGLHLNSERFHDSSLHVISFPLNLLYNFNINRSSFHFLLFFVFILRIINISCFYLILFLTGEGLETADGFVDPSVESRESSVDAWQIGPPTADAETDDTHLEPLTFFFADERTSSVSLRPVSGHPEKIEEEMK